MATDDVLVRTRIALHTVAEHVLAAGRYQAEGRIGLVVLPGGFGTPPFGSDDRTVSVVNGDLVARTPLESVRAHLTTLRELGMVAGVRPGAPATVYRPTNPLDLDAPLHVDPDAAARLAGWFELGDTALAVVRAEATGADSPSAITLWPEHFDVAFTAAGITYGASPGDDYLADPYVYVSPPAVPNRDTDTDADGDDGGDGDGDGDGDQFWNQPFGAARTWAEVRTPADAVSFFQQARRLLRPDNTTAG